MILRSLTATLVPLALLGCASGSEHLLQSVDDGGLVVSVEGLTSRSQVSLYSIEVDLSDGPEGGAFVAGECRLFEDRDGDVAFDPAADRNIGQFVVEATPHAPWKFGPLIGEIREGTPCLATRVTLADGTERSQTFAIER